MAKSAPSQTLEAGLIEAAGELMVAVGRSGATSLTPLAGGANNRVYRVDGAGAPLLLKAYFQHPEDRRDRLGAEFSFSRFAWDNGLRTLPQPLASDKKRRLGLYSFIEGRVLKPGEIGENQVREALDFYRALNEKKNRPEAEGLPSASEARFSIEGHLELVRGRLNALQGLKVVSDEDSSAVRFVNQELVPVAKAVEDSVRSHSARWGLALGKELAQAARCISPSDFGFHNALRTPDGSLRFLDFEYAGWDDPARMVGDFFSQPAVPAPTACLDLFSRGVADALPEPEACLRRIRLLLPVYRVKWACILLNDFLPAGGERRRFGGLIEDQAARKARQLAKAKHMTRDIPEP